MKKWVDAGFSIFLDFTPSSFLIIQHPACRAIAWMSDGRYPAPGMDIYENDCLASALAAANKSYETLRLTFRSIDSPLKDPLIIPVQAIEQGGLSLACEEKPEAFPVIAELIRNGELVFDAPITIAGEVEWVQNLIKAAGTVQTSIRLLCSRCLAEFKSTMSDEFLFAFSKEIPKKDDAADAAEKELTAGEIGLIHFQADHIDLHEPIQEQIVMTLPQRPLCSESCRGLCPQCGNDLNQGGCGCRQPALDDRFAVLKHFKLKTDDE